MAGKRGNKRLKSLVFLSHHSAEADIAIALKNLLESAFLGGIEVFVSSDGISIPKGEDFPHVIRNAIDESVYGISLLSPVSSQRPWVNIEFGAFWILKKKIAPVLHGSLDFKQLDAPYNNINGSLASKDRDMDDILTSIAQAVEMRVPSVDWMPFRTAITEFWNEQKKTIVSQ